MSEPDLSALADEAAIRRLTALYSDAVTHLDATKAAALYAEDGCVSIVGQETVGRAAIEAGMRASFAAFRLLRLIAHGGVIQLDGARAQARWSTLELTVRHGADTLNVILGRYEDALVREPSGWRFRRRAFSMAGRLQLSVDKLQMNPDFLATALPFASDPA